jgi:hypothetical protein
MRAILGGSGLVLIVLAAGWAATPAVAQMPGGSGKAVIGEPAPDPLVGDDKDQDKKPMHLLEKHRKKIVVLFFFRISDPASMDVLPKLVKLDKDLRTKGVVVIGITDGKKDKYEPVLKSKEVAFEIIEGNMVDPYDVSAPPRIYMVDPTGILADHFHPADDLEGRVLNQIRKTPPAGAAPEDIAKRRSAASAALDKKEYGRAYTLARELQGLTEKDEKNTNSELLKKIEGEAKKWLDDARQTAKDKDNPKWYSVLAEISVRFAGTDLGNEADKEISIILGKRDEKPLINRAKDNVRGEISNEQAAEMVASERYAEALDLYREVAEKYPDTAAAKAAEKAVDSINDDPKSQAAIAEVRAGEEADRWLDLGDRYAKVKLYGKAREYYEKVIGTHGDSPAAGRARDRIKDLPADEPADKLDQKKAEADKPADAQPADKKPAGPKDKGGKKP